MQLNIHTERKLMTKHNKKVQKIHRETIAKIQEHLSKNKIPYFVSPNRGETGCDLIIEKDGILKRVKCQVGWHQNGNINFWVTDHDCEIRRLDLIYVHDPVFKKVYRVPAPIASDSCGILRYMPVFRRKFVFAKEYEV